MSLSHDNYDFNYGGSHVGKKAPSQYFGGHTFFGWKEDPVTGRVLMVPTPGCISPAGSRVIFRASFVYRSSPTGQTMAFVGTEGSGKTMRSGKRHFPASHPPGPSISPALQGIPLMMAMQGTPLEYLL